MTGISLIVFSGQYDRAMAAFTIAAGAAGQGQKVTMFFTFWGLGLLRRSNQRRRSILQNLFKRLMPLGANDLPLSHFTFAGMGPALLRRLIRQQGGESLTDLMQLALERGVSLVACEASLKLLGLEKAELIQSGSLRTGNVHEFLETAKNDGLCLFI